MKYSNFTALYVQREKQKQTFKAFESKPMMQTLSEDKLDLKIQNDYKEMVDKVEQFGVFAFIPSIRKIAYIIHDFKIKDSFKAFAHAVHTLNDLPEDLKDAHKALLPKPNPHSDYQKPFSFIHGTFLEKTELGQKLSKYDKTLYDLQITKKALAKMGMIEEDSVGQMLKVCANNPYVKIAGRASMRFNILTFSFLSFLEVPQICTSEEKIKQTIRSVIKVTTILGMAAVTGAVGAYYCNLMGLAGIALGIMAGKNMAKGFNDRFIRLKSSYEGH